MINFVHDYERRTYSEVIFALPINANQRQKTDESGVESDVEKKILALIGVNNKIQLKEISERLEIPKRTLDRIITAMKNKGIIKRVGSARGGYWEISK